jgi:hypothetical protein
MNADPLDEWVAEVAKALELNALGPEEQALVLDVAREVAHNVLRPGAPVTTFLLGVALGRGGDLMEDAQKLITLARSQA